MIEQLSIKQLLSDYTLFVPEIQRDYVWGSKNNCKKVLLPFLQTLQSNLKEEQIYNIGFLYSYETNEDPHKENYIIDGQQRFTTIILLLYVLSAHEDKDYKNFQLCIGLDKPTMRFTYNVRPQTETFLRMLFRSKETLKDRIVNQKWYLPEYDSDMTITSMVNAVNTFATILPSLNDITYEKLLNQVFFWYFDVEETSQGEELYITMNSRGQKLTEAEQIKPYLFDKWQREKTNNGDTTDYGKIWDEWEEIFYSQKGKHGISSVDIAMNNFLRIIYEIESKNECNKEIPFRDTDLDLPKIKRYMDSMLKYADQDWSALFTENPSDRKCVVLKALIAEGLKPVSYPSERERIRRIRHIFTNIAMRRKPYKLKQNDLLAFLNEYSNSKDSLYDFIIGHPECSNEVFDEHERCKINIYKMYESDPVTQNVVELAFENTEKEQVWSGDITPIIKWSLPEDDNIKEFDFDKFKSYAQKFNSLFGDNKLKRDDMDLTRSALLTLGLHNYPFPKGQGLCFAYEPADWHNLFLNNDNIPKLKQFFDDYHCNESINDLINNYVAEDEYYDFVHNPELLKYCTQKNIQWWYGRIYLMNAKDARSKRVNLMVYKYWLSRKDDDDFNRSLKDWAGLNLYQEENSCVYLNRIGKPIAAIDAYWNGGQDHKQMAIEVFLRNIDYDIIEVKLSSLNNGLGFQWNGERYVYYFDEPEDEQQAFKLMDQKIKTVIEYLDNNIN